MNTQKRYVYVMQPTALAGSPMMAAYEVEDSIERPSELEVIRAQRQRELASGKSENMTSVDSSESFSQAIRRFTRQKLWRTRVAA